MEELSATTRKQEETLALHMRTIKSLKDENARLKERNVRLSELSRKEKVKSLSPQKKHIRLGNTGHLQMADLETQRKNVNK